MNNNVDNFSDYQDYKVFIAFKEALYDSQKDKIYIPFDKVLSKAMLGVMREVESKTDRDYLNDGITKKIKQFLNF